MEYYPVSNTPRGISYESLTLVALCTLDAIITVFLVNNGLAIEANPLLRRCIECGIGTFYFAKMFPVILLIGLAEWYRRYNPSFVKLAMGLAAKAYVLCYSICFVMANLR